jgi:multiple sugar transport system substrate-binding protein
MVRTLICVVLVCSIFVALSGCGRSAGDGPKQSVVKLQLFGDPAEIAAYKELIAAFEAANPDVKIALIPVGKQNDHMAKLTTSFVGGDAPDLFLINFRRYGQFAEKNVLEPLGPRIFERGKIKVEDLYEQPVEAFTFNGSLTCIPQNVSSLVVYYNKTLFENAGLAYPDGTWQWPAFARAAKVMTRNTAADGKTYGLGFEPSLIRLAPFIWQNNGDLVDDLNKPTKLTLDSPAAIEALNFVRSLQAKHHVVPPLAETTAESVDARFARGGLGMLLQSRRYTATLRPIKNLDWDVAPLPKKLQEMTALHSDGYCMAKDSTVKDAGYRFIEFALSPAGADILAKSGRIVPAIKAIANSPVFLDETQPPKSARVFLDSIAHMRRTPNIGVWNEVETRVDPLLEEWFYAPGNDPDAETPVGLILNEATKDIFTGGRH